MIDLEDKVRVIVDSCASIPDRLVKQLGIFVVPYYIHRGVETLFDLVDVKRKEFFEWLPTAKRLPQTANPSPGDYLNAFRRVAGKTKEIVTIHMTSKGSGACQSALAAKEMAKEIMPDLHIEVVDTLQVAMAHGWAAIEAARSALQANNIDQVTQTARQVAASGVMLQTADTLRYLYLGGRIGKAQNLLGSVLNVKPIIGMQAGVIVPLGRVRSRTKAYLRIVDMMKQQTKAGQCIKAAFTHVAAPQAAEELKEMVNARFNCVESFVAELSPALGVHTGPGTVGVCYYTTNAKDQVV